MKTSLVFTAFTSRLVLLLASNKQRVFIYGVYNLTKYIISGNQKVMCTIQLQAILDWANPHYVIFRSKVERQ
jgi:hypothetical protein